ncbi:MAG: aminopeptidase P family protein [Tannerellaceae bacterium]|jgi:Xaa-Pro aminopeptidase|nr:aminopeptidase P family protein [Tannerellaceae bacterium]
MSTIYKERIASLRDIMSRQNVAACIIPSSDAHMSEYTPDRWKTRQWLSGFTGSAGTIVVTLRKAGLWTDSRYFLQAGEQLKGSGIDLYKLAISGTPPIEDFLTTELESGETVAIDGNVFSAANAESLTEKLAGKGIKLNTAIDLPGIIWNDRPPIPSNAIFELPVKLCGFTVREKLSAINSLLRNAGADGLLLCALDEIAWTFNIRGNDVDYNPVAIAYAYISEKESILFINPEKLTAETAAHLDREGVITAVYDRTAAWLSALPSNSTLFIDRQKTNVGLFNAIPATCKIVEGHTPANRLKCRKNTVEIEGFRNALLKDGIALVRFYIWLEKQLSAGERLTEISIARKLSAFRSEQPLYISDSFATICGYGAHGAIVHYSATPETDAEIKPEGILLMDSGAQYLDGTTDITRTIALGTPTEKMKSDFTRVLQGHIRLALARFPEGTRGSQLDILARKALWDAGINYLHGTGHGIGHCLNVHEGPQSIRMEENPFPIQAGMVMSNEPGLYRTGEYGIRTENMILAKADVETEFGKFLTFETLTLCPIDTTLIDASMLSADELSWLNDYHRKVYSALAPHLDTTEQEWLKKKTSSSL